MTGQLEEKGVFPLTLTLFEDMLVNTRTKCLNLLVHERETCPKRGRRRVYMFFRWVPLWRERLYRREEGNGGHGRRSMTQP